MSYVLAGLFVLIYLPIFLLGIFFKGFKKRFMMVHSKTGGEYFVELLVGLIYFAIFLVLLFSDGVSDNVLFYFGLCIYVVGLSVAYFGYFVFVFSKGGLIRKFPYSFSRNPTYFFGLIAVCGLGLMIVSFEVFALVIVQFVLTHQIILLEEKYCKRRYGKKYVDYMKRVGRYF